MALLGRGRFVVPGLAVAVWLSTASPAPSQEGREGGLTPQEFGTTEEVTYNLNPSDFQVHFADWSDAFLNGDFQFEVASVPGSVTLVAPIHLPAGVKITSVRLYYYDDNPSSNPSCTLSRYPTVGGSNPVVTFSFPAPVSSGFTFLDGTVNTDLNLIDNDSYHYGLTLILTRSAAGQDVLRRVRIRYVRQVSPAPHSATFNDVSTSHPQHRFIEALVAAGITAGCGGGNYCPNAPITRGQMAVFLSTALGLQWPVSP